MSTIPQWPDVFAAAQEKLGDKAERFAVGLARLERGPDAQPTPAEVRRAHRWFKGSSPQNPDDVLLIAYASEVEPAWPELAEVVPLSPTREPGAVSIDRMVADQLVLQTKLLADIAGAVASLQAAVKSLQETMEKLERLPEEIREAAAPPKDNRRPA